MKANENTSTVNYIDVKSKDINPDFLAKLNNNDYISILDEIKELPNECYIDCYGAKLSPISQNEFNYFGGKPSIPSASNKEWPTCHQHGPMLFVFQTTECDNESKYIYQFFCCSEITNYYIYTNHSCGDLEDGGGLECKIFQVTNSMEEIEHPQKTYLEKQYIHWEKIKILMPETDLSLTFRHLSHSDFIDFGNNRYMHSDRLYDCYNEWKNNFNYVLLHKSGVIEKQDEIDSWHRDFFLPGQMPEGAPNLLFCRDFGAGVGININGNCKFFH